ncbi:MAG: AmmeMemoRadiSam system radical SAM enzyme [Nanoarchaeota archaeon]
MHKALLFEPLDDMKVRCTACKHYCIIQKDHTGICGVRQNKDGILYLIVYGRASAVNTDPIEKKPLFHFLPGSRIFSIGTVGCNFGCDFCQNWDLSQASKEIKKRLMKEKHSELADVEVGRFGYDLPPERIVDTCHKASIPSIAYTYNEPIIFFEYLYDTARLAKKQGIRNVFVSNGYESNESLEKMKGLLDAMNIDLKSFSEDFYTKTCKAKLKPVLDTIRHAHALGIWLEITTLIIPTKNDSDEELKNIAGFIASVDKDIPWHVTAFHPDYKMKNLAPTSKETLLKAYAIGKKAGLSFVYVGNIIDEEHSSTYCPKCNALLIRRGWHDAEITSSFSGGACRKCGERIAGVWDQEKK